MGKEAIKIGIEKIKDVGKNANKVLKTAKIVKKGAAVGMAVLDKVSPEKAEKIVDNMENLQTKIDNNTQGFQKFLAELEKKYDASVGNRLENQVVQIEKWIANHGGNAVEKFLSEQNNPSLALISPELIKTVSKTFKRVWKRKSKKLLES